MVVASNDNDLDIHPSSTYITQHRSLSFYATHATHSPTLTLTAVDGGDHDLARLVGPTKVDEKPRRRRQPHPKLPLPLPLLC